jgi:GT2 family glycosyltransferase
MTPGLDVVIVSFNTREDLDACLTSLHAHPPRELRHVVVVDNASTDGSPQHVRDRWPTVRLIALDRNVGFGAANNVAMRQSDADLLLLLNSDTRVPPGAIDTLAERLAATSAVAAGPRLLDAKGRPEVSFGRMLSPWTEAVQRVRVRLAARDGLLAQRYVRALVAKERDVDWVSGACLLVRRPAALEAGLFDERYFMYEEDVDFCAALRARGGRILFTPKAEVVHLRGRSIGRLAGGERAIYDRSHLAFYEKHSPGWAPILRWWQGMRGRARAPLR